MLFPGAGRYIVSLSHLPSRSCLRFEPVSTVLQRVIASDTTASTFQRSSPALKGQNYRLFSFTSRRNYATSPASRPKAHTGRATAPRAKKSSVTSTKTSLKAKASPKPKTKAKAKAKTKAKSKAKPKAGPKTEEQKLKAKISALRKVALKTPALLPANSFLVLNSEMSKGKGLGAIGREAGVKYRTLTPEEREHYNHIAIQNKSKNDATFEQWLSSHSIIDIHKANLARAHLTRLGVKGYSRKLKDQRMVKRPTSPTSLFLSERYKSGEMKGLKLADASRLIYSEWRDLPQASKKKFVDASLEDRQRYANEMKDKLGVVVGLNDPAVAPAASAA